MKKRLIRPERDEDARIAVAMASDPDSAPGMCAPIAGILRRPGRPPKANPKVAITLRLDQEVIDRFKATGQSWQTRINAALGKSKVG
jgi:uncharacterized protein (DUF4415 family)